MLRLGLPEFLIIFCIVIFVFASDVLRVLRSPAPAETFNRNFFALLSLILLFFALAEFWLLSE
jgi:hypothetical protein